MDAKDGMNTIVCRAQIVSVVVLCLARDCAIKLSYKKKKRDCADEHADLQIGTRGASQTWSGLHGCYFKDVMSFRFLCLAAASHKS